MLMEYKTIRNEWKGGSCCEFKSVQFRRQKTQTAQFCTQPVLENLLLFSWLKEWGEEFAGFLPTYFLFIQKCGSAWRLFYNEHVLMWVYIILTIGLWEDEGYFPPSSIALTPRLFHCSLLILTLITFSSSFHIWAARKVEPGVERFEKKWIE